MSATLRKVPRQRLIVLTALAGYNLIQNRVLRPRWYVPCNFAVSAGLVAFARQNGCTWEELGLDLADAGGGFRLGSVVASVVSAGAVLAASHPTVAHHLRDERAANQTPADMVYRIFVRFPIGTALFEEVAFRGVVEGMWTHDGAGKREAAVAAAVLFGLWHLMPTHDALGGNPLRASLSSRAARSGTVVAGAAATGLASLGFSWLRSKSKGLIAPWMAHTSFGVAAYLAGVTAWRRLP